MAVSKKIKKYMTEGGWIRKMFEEGIALQKKYGVKNVFDLSLGNPILNPPSSFAMSFATGRTNPGRVCTVICPTRATLRHALPWRHTFQRRPACLSPPTR